MKIEQRLLKATDVGDCSNMTCAYNTHDLVYKNMHLSSASSALASTVQSCSEHTEAWPGKLTVLVETQLIDLDGALWFQGCSSLIC